MTKQIDIGEISLPPAQLLLALNTGIPPMAYDIMGTFLSSVELLGQRTADLHLALTSDLNDPNFAPEEFSSFYQRSIYQYMRNQSGQTLLLLKKQLKNLPAELQPQARLVLNQREQILGRFKLVLDQPITAMRARCHGNYHLEELLYTGKDFIIVDFEGEPNRSLSERRMKRSPLRDIAGMLQSFYYACRVALRREIESGLVRSENLSLMEQWAQFFYSWTSLLFLKQYLATTGEAAFLPKTQPELKVLLDAYLLEKAVYELDYEMRNRPDWVGIPLQRILELLEASKMGF